MRTKLPGLLLVLWLSSGRPIGVRLREYAEWYPGLPAQPRGQRAPAGAQSLEGKVSDAGPRNVPRQWTGLRNRADDRFAVPGLLRPLVPEAARCPVRRRLRLASRDAQRFAVPRRRCQWKPERLDPEPP